MQPITALFFIPSTHSASSALALGTTGVGAAPPSSAASGGGAGAGGSGASDSAGGAGGGVDRLQYYFSIQNQLHRITYIRRGTAAGASGSGAGGGSSSGAGGAGSTGSFEIKRHLLKTAVQTLDTIPYRYSLWSDHSQSFVSVERDIEPTRDDFDWNYADHVC
jgi:hypothetical protein